MLARVNNNFDEGGQWEEHGLFELHSEANWWCDLGQVAVLTRSFSVLSRGQ